MSISRIAVDVQTLMSTDYTGVIYEVVTEGSAPAVSASEAAAQPAPKPSKKKGGKSSDPDEDRSNDPTLGIGTVAPQYWFATV